MSSGQPTNNPIGKSGSWLQRMPVPVSATYEQPTFAEPEFVMRNVNRVAVTQGYRAGWPTFVPDDPTWPPGRVNTYDATSSPTASPRCPGRTSPRSRICPWSRRPPSQEADSPGRRADGLDAAPAAGPARNSPCSRRNLCHAVSS